MEVLFILSEGISVPCQYLRDNRHYVSAFMLYGRQSGRSDSRSWRCCCWHCHCYSRTTYYSHCRGKPNANGHSEVQLTSHIFFISHLNIFLHQTHAILKLTPLFLSPASTSSSLSFPLNGIKLLPGRSWQADYCSLILLISADFLCCSNVPPLLPGCYLLSRL